MIIPTPAFERAPIPNHKTHAETAASPLPAQSALRNALAGWDDGAGLLTLFDQDINRLQPPVADAHAETRAAQYFYSQEWSLWTQATAGHPGWTPQWVTLLVSRITGLMLGKRHGRNIPPAIRNHWDNAAKIDDTADEATWLAAYAAMFSGGKETALPPHWRQILPLARPLDHLLTSDGDTRLQIDDQGYSPYGLNTQPSAEVCFSSTTATPIDGAGYVRAAMMRRQMIRLAVRHGYDQAFARIAAAQRRHLAHHVQTPAATVILCPSGTHAAMLPLFLQPPQALTVILVGAVETGRGVPMAAAGRVFDPLAVDGGTGVPGTAVDDDLSRRTEVVDIPLRDRRGSPRGEEAICEEILATITQAVAQERRVLLYAIAGSKTGLAQPSLDRLDQWRRQWPTTLDVVIDACQMRLETAAMAAHLERGHIVLLTGSKMATALPFCGAVLLPPVVAARHVDLPPLPPGLAAHSNRAYWPEWGSFCAALPACGGPGTLLRWESAFVHLDAFAAMPRPARTRLLRDLTDGMIRVFADHPRCRLLPEAAEGKPVLAPIFSFQVQGQDGRMLDMARLRRLYHLLQRREKPYHVGQPVLLATAGSGPGEDEIAVMRVAVDARMVHTIYDGRVGKHWGTSRDARLRRVLNRLSETLKTIAQIAEAT